MEFELLMALRRGDAIFVRQLFSQDNADEAGRRSWRGVTIGGNSALHIAADFRHLALAALICARDDSSLLRVRNVAGEMPLHCAARAGADRIVFLFISVAKRQEDGSWLEEVLRGADREGKTALHAAAEEGHVKVAEVLMSADPGLAAMVDSKGISPLYAAVLSGSLELVRILTGSHADGGDTPEASYAGPNGQTALHAAAIIQSPEIAGKLLQWEPNLTKKVDSSGSTPLHYLATTSNRYMMRQLLDIDTSPAYFSDSKGLCPIHVAAWMGRLPIIQELICHCPDMGELVDGRGRNFLHVATLHKRVKIVRVISKNPLFVRITNARDFEGNTPLHLAVKSENQTIVSLLLGNVSVRPSIMNKDGKTPLDLAIAGLDFGFYLSLNPSVFIFRCLKGIGAMYGRQRLDELVAESTTQPDREKELKKYESTTQNLVIAAVLIATVTFAAAFTLPGGYQNGGTPTLARKYAFKAFIVADLLAFICSGIATILLMYAGSLVAGPSLRQVFISGSSFFLRTAAHSLVAAFVMSVYVVLAPVDKPFSILACIFAFASILLFASPQMSQLYRLAGVLRSRLGWWRMWKARVASRPDINDGGPTICRFIFHQVVYYLLIYIIIFLVPLLIAFPSLLYIAFSLFLVLAVWFACCCSFM